MHDKLHTESVQYPMGKVEFSEYSFWEAIYPIKVTYTFLPILINE